MEKEIKIQWFVYPSISNLIVYPQEWYSFISSHCGILIETLVDLYRETGIHIPRLSRIELGIFTARPDEKSKIAKTLRVPEGDLFVEQTG